MRFVIVSLAKVCGGEPKKEVLSRFRWGFLSKAWGFSGAYDFWASSGRRKVENLCKDRALKAFGLDEKASLGFVHISYWRQEEPKATPIRPIRDY